MSLTAGTASLVARTSTTASLSATAATSGTAPYTYQWYRSLVSGFTPGPANEIAGATELTLEDSGLIPGTQYYYKLVVTDSATTPAEATYTQVSVVTLAPTQNPNQFNQAPTVGMLDLLVPPNSVSVIIDASQATPLYAGAALKMVDSEGGVPKVVGCTAEDDEVIGFLNYNIKNINFVAGQPAEMSMKNNVMYLYATAAIARGAEVLIDLTTNGGVKPATGSSGKRIVGWAYDKAANSGKLIRVYLEVPSFKLDS